MGCQLLDNVDEFMIIKDGDSHFLSIKNTSDNKIHDGLILGCYSNNKSIFCKKCNQIIGKFIIRSGYKLVSLNYQKMSISGVNYMDINELILDDIINVSNLPEAIDSLLKTQIIDRELMKYDWEGLTKTIPADFQIEAYLEGIFSNLIISVQTGLGKTLIAMMLIKKFQELYPQKACLFIVQTQPLVEQHMKTIISEINVEVEGIKGGRQNTSAINLMSSRKACVIIGTSGALENYFSIVESNIEHFGLIIFDECHHCAKEHKFNKILGRINQCMKEKPSLKIRLIGMSATPISTTNILNGRVELGKLLEKFNNPLFYFIQSSMSNKNAHYKYIDLTIKQNEILHLLLLIINSLLRIRINECENYIKIFNDLYNIKNILEKKSIQNTENILEYIEVINELDATQESDLILLIYIYEIIFWMDSETAKGEIEKISNIRIKTSLQEIIEEVGDEIPQRIEVLNEEIMNINEKSRVLIFCEQQSIAREMCGYIRRTFPKHRTEYVVGHNGKSGMKWNNGQQKNLDDFRCGKCNILISTSVLEEGIDVPSCNLVIKYSSVNSTISLIQSCGRARSDDSKYVVINFKFEEIKIRELLLEENYYNQIISENDDVSTPSEYAVYVKKYIENCRITALP